MLLRPPRVPPSFFLLLVIFGLLAYHFLQTSVQIDDPRQLQTSPPSPRADQAKAPRIALITFVTEQRSYLYTSLKNKDFYSRRHGLDFIIDYEAHLEADKGTTWYKNDMTERLIKENKWDWIWWLDFDTLITNTDISVLDIIDEALENAPAGSQIDWLLTHDCNGLNTGSYVVRSNLRAMEDLHKVAAVERRESTDERHLSEQDAMVQLLKEDPAFARRTVKVPQWKLNAFPAEIPCYDEPKRAWEQGMFVLHFAGAWAHVRGEDPTGQLMRKYAPQIYWGDGEGDDD